MMFIFVTKVGFGLGYADLRLFYDELETTRIVSICDA
jgi:hypothetical protein